jgi:hypothetical protein
MKLKTIKSKQCDTTYTKYVFKALDLIKNKCQIPQSAVMFFLGYFHFGQVFLCNGIIYVAKTSMEYSETREPVVETKPEPEPEPEPVAEPAPATKKYVITNLGENNVLLPPNYSTDDELEFKVINLLNEPKENFTFACENKFVKVYKRKVSFLYIYNFKLIYVI